MNKEKTRQCVTCHNFVELPEIYCNICKTKHQHWIEEQEEKEMNELSKTLIIFTVTLIIWTAIICLFISPYLLVPAVIAFLLSWG